MKNEYIIYNNTVLAIEIIGKQLHIKLGYDNKENIKSLGIYVDNILDYIKHTGKYSFYKSDKVIKFDTVLDAIYKIENEYKYSYKINITTFCRGYLEKWVTKQQLGRTRSLLEINSLVVFDKRYKIKIKEIRNTRNKNYTYIWRIMDNKNTIFVKEKNKEIILGNLETTQWLSFINAPEKPEKKFFHIFKLDYSVIIENISNYLGIDKDKVDITILQNVRKRIYVIDNVEMTKDYFNRQREGKPFVIIDEAEKEKILLDYSKYVLLKPDFKLNIILNNKLEYQSYKIEKPT